MRDYSKASEAANLRILGATRLHCDSFEVEGDSSITERWLARGTMEEDQCDRFNRSLRRGQVEERIRFRVED